MSKNITLCPVPMDRDNMSRLEDKGLIYRLAPGKDTAGPVSGNNLGRSLYESEPRFGGHKLIVATIDTPVLSAFGCHEDNEDVWMLGLDSCKPMFFVIATCLADEFESKVSGGALTAEDFVCLRARYNDPEASFFVMNKFVPHGEFVLPSSAPSPSFYVTESTDLKIRPVRFGEYAVTMQDGSNTVTVSP